MTSPPPRARWRAAALGSALAAAVLVAAPAAAHVDIDPTEALAGSTAVVTFSFQHGLDGTDTTALEVQVPRGAEVVDVPDKQGWAIDVSETDPQVVTWSGGRVPDGVEESFPVEVRLPDEPGEALFPAIQTTDAGELAWIAQDGGASEADRPAPRITLVVDPDAPPPTEAPEPEPEPEPEPAETTTTTTVPVGLDEGEGPVEVADDGAPSWLAPVGIVALAAIALAVAVGVRRDRT